MTDILLALIALELGVGLWRVWPRAAVPTVTIAPSNPVESKSNTVAIYDSEGNLRFTRPSGHPDILEIKTPYKDNRYAGWTVERTS